MAKIKVTDTNKVEIKMASNSSYRHGLDVGTAVARLNAQGEIGRIRSTWWAMLEDADKEWRNKVEGLHHFYSKLQKRRQRTVALVSGAAGALLVVLTYLVAIHVA